MNAEPDAPPPDAAALMLSQAELDMIRERAERATPGPWQVVHRASDRTADDDWDGCLGLEIEGPPAWSQRGQFDRAADAQFIAHSRVDIARLLADLAAARRALAFYADEGHYLEEKPARGEDAWESKIDADAGARARTALAAPAGRARPG